MFNFALVNAVGDGADSLLELDVVEFLLAFVIDRNLHHSPTINIDLLTITTHLMPTITTQHPHQPLPPSQSPPKTTTPLLKER